MLGFASFLSLDIQEEMLNVTVKVRVLSLYYYFYTITHINWWILWTLNHYHLQKTFATEVWEELHTWHSGESDHCFSHWQTPVCFLPSTSSWAPLRLDDKGRVLYWEWSPFSLPRPGHIGGWRWNSLLHLSHLTFNEDCSRPGPGVGESVKLGIDFQLQPTLWAG